jgi:hypothetical protein
MSIHHNHNKIGIGLMAAGTCVVLAGLYVVLVGPGTVLAAKPGNIPVCIEFGAGGGVQSDDGPYCDDKQLKVEAIMTPDGHVNLSPNTGTGGRTLYVDVNFDPGNEENPLVIRTEGWRLLIGGWQDNFDMRDMDPGEARTDVNLFINTEVPDDPPDGADGLAWRLIFDPSYTRWGIDYSDSTYVTVTRGEEPHADTWEIKVDLTDRAVLVLQRPLGKNKSDFIRFPGLVSVPPFTATVTLIP